MPNIDIFAGDAFNTSSLINAMETLPYKPSMLSSLGISKEKPVYTRDVWIERKKNRLSILKTAPVNTIANVIESQPRLARPFRVPYIPQFGSVMASEISGIRAFGTETELELVSDVVNDKLEIMKDNHEVTREFHLVSALKGILYDGDATSVIYNYFTEFGFSQSIVNFYQASGNLRQLCSEIIRLIAARLGGETHGPIIGLCGDQYFDAVVGHSSTQDAYDRWRDGEFKRMSHLGEAWYTLATEGFMMQNILFANYRGEIGDVRFIPTDEAYFFPTGVKDFIEEALAPADFMETVNTRGRRYYVKQKMMDHNVGVELFSQSNVLTVNKRPEIVVKSQIFSGSSSSSSA